MTDQCVDCGAELTEDNSTGWYCPECMDLLCQDCERENSGLCNSCDEYARGEDA